MTVRHAWNWAKIKSDPKNPFFAKRSTKNTPQTAVILLSNAEIPMLQIRPPVFLPATSEQGLIHYIQIANEHLSLIIPTYNISNGGTSPELIPVLLKTFLESSAYTKIGFGTYEDVLRIKDQYGITCKNIFDIHWMAKVMGIGSVNVGMLHNVFGDIHDNYIPGRISKDGHVSEKEQEGQVIDPRRWDWESHGSIELSRELIRCIAQDAFVTLRMYDNIQERKFRPGYQPLLTDPQGMSAKAMDFLLTSLPRGTMIPVRSIHHLLKGPFMGSDINNVDRDAQALALVKLLVDRQELITDKNDTAPLTFKDPIDLSRRIALPGIRSSEAILTNPQTRKIAAEVFNCRADELRLMQDSDLTRKPDKIQDLECFLGVYEWLDFLPGAELDEPLDRRLQSGSNVSEGCGRKEATLLALFMNFGTVADRAKDQPTETKRWVAQRIERLVQQGALLRTGGPQGLIRVNPALLRKLKRIETNVNRHHHVVENKALSAN
ncbi:hypothetical protein BGZ54_009838 [Gamsiella multidivaricata]|nr:hypothetical protein BGZ54_009838 [Gamsiella multidivaricata]